MTNRIACCLLLAGACATPMSSLRADNRRLSQNVDDLRADRRAQDRKIKDLEHQLAIAKSQQAAPDVPQLPVEVVAPPHASQQGAPGDPRVVAVEEDGTQIVYEGDAALGKSAAIDEDSLVAVTQVRAHDRLEVTQRIPPISARAAHRSMRADVVHDSVPANDAAANDYRSAVELVKTGKHDEAVTALRAFLKAYPRHDYADNAQYWLGESFYARKDYQQALTEFRATIETYPRGNKVPDALLKVGYCYSALGQKDKARAIMEQVVNLYPKSEPAALAAKRLETP